jgi:acetyltransferase-like isoleucine patch superfamily enzyme
MKKILRFIFNTLKIIKGIYQKQKVLYFTCLAKLKVKKYGEGLVVNKRSSFTPNTYLGKNVNFQGMYIVGSGKVKIGDNFHCGPDCMIMSHYHNFRSGTALPYDNSYIVEDVTIEDNVWLGARVIILPGVHIGEGAVIQAGSVVVSDIPALGIAGGHPARVFSERDHEHYFNLKKSGKFF